MSSEHGPTPPLDFRHRPCPSRNFRLSLQWAVRGRPRPAPDRLSSRRHEDSMAGAELRPALEQRLAALAIRTEVVEHPEVRRSR